MNGNFIFIGEDYSLWFRNGRTYELNITVLSRFITARYESVAGWVSFQYDSWFAFFKNWQPKQ